MWVTVFDGSLAHWLRKGTLARGQGNLHAITKPDLRSDPWWSINVLRCHMLPGNGQGPATVGSGVQLLSPASQGAALGAGRAFLGALLPLGSSTSGAVLLQTAAAG